MTSTCVHQEDFIMCASWPVHFTYWRSQCLPMTCLLAWWHQTCWTEFNTWLSLPYPSMGHGYSFVGPDSSLLFSLLATDHAWLTIPPAQWSDNGHYAEMSAVIRDLAVVNDTAERCIKDIQDYANAANDGDHRGNIILVSASHRIEIPSFLKNEIKENLWSLYFSAESHYFCWTNNLLIYLMYGSVISSASEKHARQYNFHILSYFWVLVNKHDVYNYKFIFRSCLNNTYNLSLISSAFNDFDFFI